MSVWQGVGVLAAIYVAYAVLTGTVHAKDGMHMETIYRAMAPGRFWLVIAIYTGLVLALFFIF